MAGDELPGVTWVWVSLPYATYGIQVRDRRVVWAPAVARWMRGKDWIVVQRWLNKREAEWEPL
jgi:hypothetical protein